MVLRGSHNEVHIMGTLDIYDRCREVPESAAKEITGGRLSGKTSINPMWRIKKLTEVFGACGIGWKYTIDKQWTELSGSGEIAAFCNISLYIKVDGTWSDAIPGTGGSGFVVKEQKGAYMSDECYKMALTDALSVACKSLGVGADVYYYEPAPQPAPAPELICTSCGNPIKKVKRPDGSFASPEEVKTGCGGMCYSCYSKTNG